MKCHYEVLEIERDAEPEEIKKSYRKLALKWHPDKNPDKIEECTKYFSLLQQAYEVLSDPRERDFYDRHRESILKGGFDGDEKEESVDLFKFFSASCYKNYGNDDKGFFAIYRKIFEKIANEDYDQMDKYDEKNYPMFGDADSDYETTVGAFYGFWSSFSTCRSFAWLDKYDIRQASNRWEARQIEAENKKFREAGKQERNDQIRQLVAFVRKRDPRVRAYREELEKKQAEAKKKQEENRKKQIRQNLSAFEEDEKAEAERIAHLMEVSLQMAENYDTCSDEEQTDDQAHCIVCNKSFRSLNAKLNHENSKQHIKQLNELRKHMKEEDAELFDHSAGTATEIPTKPTKSKKGGRRKKGNGIFDVDEEIEKEHEILDELPQNSDTVIAEETVERIEEEIPKETEKKEKKKRRADKTKNAVTEQTGDDDDGTTIQKTGKCERCKQVFDSRSKLFAHLKETGHATLLVNKKPEPKKKNKKGRRDDDDDW